MCNLLHKDQLHVSALFIGHLQVNSQWKGPKHVVGLYVISYKYLYHHTVVLDRYTNSNLVYYKHNGDKRTLWIIMKMDLIPETKGQVGWRKLFYQHSYRNLKKKSKFCDPALIDFYKLYLLHHEFPVLTNHEWQISLFGSVCICAQFFLKATTVKNPYTNPLDDERFENCPRVWTSHISPGINTEVNTKQCQFAHRSHFLRNSGKQWLNGGARDEKLNAIKVIY